MFELIALPGQIVMLFGVFRMRVLGGGVIVFGRSHLFNVDRVRSLLFFVWISKVVLLVALFLRVNLARFRVR